MNYGELLNSIPYECKEILRKIEKVEKRLIRIRSLKQFVENYYQHNTLPKYINNSIYKHIIILKLKVIK